MYQLLVGRLPFEGSTAPELIDAIRTLPPQPIPDTVPNPVAKILLRALNKNPEHRFHSVTAMSHALEHVLTKPPSSPVDSMARTKTHWVTYFRTRWQQNSRKYILGTLLVMAIGAVSLGLYYASLPGIYLKRASSGAQSADESISALTYVIERQPGNAEAYMLRGKAFDQKGQLDAALQDFSRYIELRMTDPNGYLLRGNILERKCACNSAIDDYTRVLILQPQNSYAYFCRGRATVSSGNTDQGLEDVKTAIRISPKENAYYMFRGTVLLDGKGDAEAAIKDFSTVIAADPNYEGAHFYRGRAHAENDDDDSAIADYTTETQLDPANYASYYNRGLQYYARKQNDLALADMRTALQLDAEDPEARYMIGKILLENKDYNGAIEKFNDALAQWKTNAERYQAQREANADCTCNPAYEDPNDYVDLERLRRNIETFIEAYYA